MEESDGTVLGQQVTPSTLGPTSRAAAAIRVGDGGGSPPRCRRARARPGHSRRTEAQCTGAAAAALAGVDRSCASRRPGHLRAATVTATLAPVDRFGGRAMPTWPRRSGGCSWVWASTWWPCPQRCGGSPIHRPPGLVGGLFSQAEPDESPMLSAFARRGADRPVEPPERQLQRCTARITRLRSPRAER